MNERKWQTCHPLPRLPSVFRKRSRREKEVKALGVSFSLVVVVFFFIYSPGVFSLRESEVIFSVADWREVEEYSRSIKKKKREKEEGVLKLNKKFPVSRTGGRGGSY